MVYNYNPQNSDELELKEGDWVSVMEKCEDGWFIGTSLKSGRFGTFPGNYVRLLCKLILALINVNYLIITNSDQFQE